MSGGHYENGISYRINDVASRMKDDIRDFMGDTTTGIPNQKVMIRLREAYDIVRMAAVMVERVDYLMSSDDGDDTFLERLRAELKDILPSSPNGKLIKSTLLGDNKMKAPFKKQFVPPTPDEVIGYLQTIMSEIDTQINSGYLPKKYYFDVDAFIAYYETRNWHLGGGRVMSSWKGAVRTWIANDRRRHTGG